MWTCRFIFRASTNKSSWPFFFFFFWSKPIHFQVNFESSRNLHMKGRGTRLGDGWPRKEKKKKKIILNEERKKRKKKKEWRRRGWISTGRWLWLMIQSSLFFSVLVSFTSFFIGFLLFPIQLSQRRAFCCCFSFELHRRRDLETSETGYSVSSIYEAKAQKERKKKKKKLKWG